MNEELQKALAEFVKATLAGFQAGKDFVLAEAPEVIQQLIRWKFWEASVWAVFCGAACLLFVAVGLRKEGWRINSADDLDESPLPLVALAGIGFGGFIAMTKAMVALQIYVAPKVWLIEWAMKAIK